MRIGLLNGGQLIQFPIRLTNHLGMAGADLQSNLISQIQAATIVGLRKDREDQCGVYVPQIFFPKSKRQTQNRKARGAKVKS